MSTVLLCLVIAVIVFPPTLGQDPGLNGLEIEFRWNYINFTWPSATQYKKAIRSKAYIPGNVIPTGIKVYKNKIYLAMPQFREGVPVSLATISVDKSKELNPLVAPFPSWEENIQNNCNSLQSVHGMEIDQKGKLWVLDGVRMFNRTECPVKLVIYDLNNRGRRVLSHKFAERICSRIGCFLDEIVIDGDFAYISDHSFIDPGIIVFSVKEKRSWKLRDGTMFPKLDGPKELTDNLFGNLDGIALLPSSTTDNGEKTKTVYYCSFTSYDLYSVETKYITNYSLIPESQWKNEIKYVGDLLNITSSLFMDNKARLLYVLPAISAIGIWDTTKPFSSSEIYAQNDEMEMPAAIDISETQELRVLTNNLDKLFNPNYVPDLNTVYFRIFKKPYDANKYIVQ